MESVAMVELKSGLRIRDPLARLLEFCNEEYAYYDGLLPGDPNRIEPMDVLATVSVNSFVNRADLVRSVHKGMANACDRLIREIPITADIVDYGSNVFPIQRLLESCLEVRGVLIPVATKILHRKRPKLIPMVDNVVLEHYLKNVIAAGEEKAFNRVWGQTQDKGNPARIAAIAVSVLVAFRSDLMDAARAITALQGALGEHGYGLSLVRILEILVWTETEPSGYYRQKVAGT